MGVAFRDRRAQKRKDARIDGTYDGMRASSKRLHMTFEPSGTSSAHRLMIQFTLLVSSSRAGGVVK